MCKTKRFMSFSKNIAAVVITLLFLTSCSSIDIFKENTQLAVAKPYSTFVIINQEANISGFKSEFIDHQVQIHLLEALEAEGLTYDKENPDLVIRYFSNEDPRQRTTNNYSTPYPYWGYRAWDPWATSRYMNPNYGSRTTNYELLQVIVDFIDPKQDKFLMTLTGVTEVSSPKGKEKQVLRTVDKIVNSFITDLSQ